MGNFMCLGLACPPKHQSLICQTPKINDFTTLEIEDEDLKNETSEKREQQMSVKKQAALMPNTKHQTPNTKHQRVISTAY